MLFASSMVIVMLAVSMVPVCSDSSDGAPGTMPVEVVFDSRGGTGGPTGMTANHDGITISFFDIPDAIPVREGFTFMGWTIDPLYPSWAVWPGMDMEVTYAYDQAPSSEIPDQITLYALWAQGTGTADDPLRPSGDPELMNTVKGSMYALHGKYVESGWDLIVYGDARHVCDCPDYDGEWGVKHDGVQVYWFESEMYYYGYAALESGEYDFVFHRSSSSINPVITNRITIHIIDDVASLAFLSDPVSNGDITFAGS